MAQLILLRHGLSAWNLDNRFTGWEDVPLAEQGVKEAEQAGETLKTYKPDYIFTSKLKRAIDTASILERTAGWKNTIHIEDKALNERHYGLLQGMNKDEARTKFGVEQVHKWRRSFDIQPPEGESLKNTCERVIPFYIQHIEPLLIAGKRVLVVAHGNSLRGLIKKLENIADNAIAELEIPTCVPIIYEIDYSGKAIGKPLWLR